MAQTKTKLAKERMATEPVKQLGHMKESEVAGMVSKAITGHPKSMPKMKKGMKAMHKKM